MVVSADENAKKKGIMPIANPTGNPFLRSIKIPKDDEALKKLQVKVDLFKIGEAPRAFSELLKQAEVTSKIVIDSSQQGRLFLCDRF